MSSYYIAGAYNLPGTGVPGNVMGDCGHRHRTEDTAWDCLARTTRKVKRLYGEDAFCDRQVLLVVDGVKTRPRRKEIF
jgi:hypothetical protein